MLQCCRLHGQVGWPKRRCTLHQTHQRMWHPQELGRKPSVHFDSEAQDPSRHWWCDTARTCSRASHSARQPLPGRHWKSRTSYTINHGWQSHRPQVNDQGGDCQCTTCCQGNSQVAASSAGDAAISTYSHLLRSASPLTMVALCRSHQATALSRRKLCCKQQHHLSVCWLSARCDRLLLSAATPLNALALCLSRQATALISRTTQCVGSLPNAPGSCSQL